MADLNERYMKRLGSLKLERESYYAHWKKITDTLLPRSGRYFLEDRNKGERRNTSIYDSTGTRALNILAAGMMAGMSSPARKWFNLALSDRELMEFQPVKEWLAQAAEILRDIFARSNAYRVLHGLYEEMGAFGTGCAYVFRDHKDLIRLYPQTVGEFYLGQSNRFEVDTIYREFQMQIAPLVQEFEYKNVSKTAQAQYDKGNMDEWVTVMHAIQPRKERDLNKSNNTNMAWESVFIEPGQDNNQTLRESGFNQFPALTPRWIVRGGDVYGSDCPGMTALGDILQLQDDQLKKAKGIDYMSDPPLQIPTALRGSEDVLPGGISYYDPAAPTGGIRSSFEVNLNLQHLLEDILDVRGRINSAFFVDMFQMISSQQRMQPETAREVQEKHEEKLLILGPVLERNQNELLDPLIDNAFMIALEEGHFPPPPEEMQGHEISIEYISMLAQAQKAVGIGSLDRIVGTVGQMAAVRPEALDKLNTDQIIDEYSNMLGIAPHLIVANEEVAIIRQDRAAAQAQAQQMAAIPEMANTAKTLSETNVGEGTALDNVASQFTQL
ncbi:MAG: phage head-tail adapter protein [Gammaproteobacteria bacterium]|nr:phage head-tail adapter protein [Gammaproteobacteria bacterium]